MKIINIEYTATVNLESVHRGRTLYVSDEVATDLYGYEIDDGTEREYLELLTSTLEGLEALEGNACGAIQSIG